MSEQRFKHYHYAAPDGGLLRITAKSRPGLSLSYKTWCVREFVKGKWEMPVIAEITWHALSRLEYLGNTTPKEPA